MRKQTMVYYADGYHGGIRGHMPLGSFRDILEKLRQYPEWKLSLDIEPVSFDTLLQRDPAAYAQLREMLKDGAFNARLEIVSGSYAQPYSWLIDGESTIRHLTLGLKKLREHFPFVDVITYAVQEPCWTSALPQMLKSLGFRYAVLKNPSTAWGGYSQGYPAEICLWQGPDGTRIPLVPRYQCEELVNVWETEACMASESYAEKCAREGIAHPAGMCYQDLGWPATPKLADAQKGLGVPEHIRFVTWKEYFSSIADKPAQVWRISQEVFLGALPWGERLLARLARQVRKGEAELLDAERVNALCAVLTGKRFDGRIEEAWKHLLMAQHHDGWICAAAGADEKNWAWIGSAETYAAAQITQEISRQALVTLAASLATEKPSEELAETILALNPLCNEEERVIRVPITSSKGTQAYQVSDGEETIVSQYIPSRRYEDGSVCAGELVFEAALPALGGKTFAATPLSAPPPLRSGARAYIEGRYAYLENNHLRLQFDLRQGGIITSMLSKKEGREWIDPHSELGFNEYKGYFVERGCYCSSRTQPADATVLSDGPLEASLEIKGSIANAAFRQVVTLPSSDAPVRVDVCFQFSDPTYIGDPKEIVDKSDWKDGYRSHHDGRYKLNAYFPTAFTQERLYKDAAFDVCQSQLDDTYFSTWSEIKHNILLHWADVCDERQGLMIACDRTTGYTHGKDTPFALALAWGWDGGFWWGRRKLKGEQSMQYSFYPHTGDWRHARLPHLQQHLLHPVYTQRLPEKLHQRWHRSLLNVLTEGIETSAVLLDEQGNLLVRLFNAGTHEAVRFTADARLCREITTVTLDGRQEDCLYPQASSEQRDVSTFQVPIVPFGIVTLCFVLHPAK